MVSKCHNVTNQFRKDLEKVIHSCPNAKMIPQAAPALRDIKNAPKTCILKMLEVTVCPLNF